MTHTDILYEKKDGIAWITINIDSEQRAGVAHFAHTALALYYQTDEALEGRNAFVEKRPVNFAKFRA